MRIMGWQRLATAALCASLVACGGATEDGEATSRAANPAGTSPATPAAAAPAFRAVIEGALDRVVEGSDAVSGARYGRYHINLLSPRTESQPAAIIAFGRPDESTPGAGTYALGDGGAFGGSVELYSDPQREFAVDSGEIVITGAQGDQLTGTFVLTARELVEEYTSTPPTIRVEGTFKTRPVK